MCDVIWSFRINGAGVLLSVPIVIISPFVIVILAIDISESTPTVCLKIVSFLTQLVSCALLAALTWKCQFSPVKSLNLMVPRLM